MTPNEHKKQQQNLFVRALIEQEKIAEQQRRKRNRRDIELSKTKIKRARPKGGQG